MSEPKVHLDNIQNEIKTMRAHLDLITEKQILAIAYIEQAVQGAKEIYENEKPATSD